MLNKFGKRKIEPPLSIKSAANMKTFLTRFVPIWRRNRWKSKA